ncbi:MAG: NUDIX hydrolase [Cetobacterium sp.]|uniref:NUDIX hydrolase n=1 Tax=Cetobacterium sp. TaxID=2071632 RepID=UPI003F3435FF
MGYLTRKIEKLVNGMEVLKLGRSVNFLIITADKQLILAEQPRAATYGAKIMNLYGGMVDEKKEEKILEAALRELKEEINLDVGDLKEVRAIYRDKNPSPGVMDELNSLYFFYLNDTADEVKKKIKCNDTNEDIVPKFIHVTTAKKISVNALGLKTWLALQLVSAEQEV